MKTMLFLPALASAALISSAASASPAASDTSPISEPVSVAVRIDDLRVDEDRGAHVALRRMSRAAEKACGPSPEAVRTVAYRTRYGYCVRANMDALVQEAAAPRVSELYAASGRYASAERPMVFSRR